MKEVERLVLGKNGCRSGHLCYKGDEYDKWDRRSDLGSEGVPPKERTLGSDPTVRGKRKKESYRRSDKT